MKKTASHLIVIITFLPLTMLKCMEREVFKEAWKDKYRILNEAKDAKQIHRYLCMEDNVLSIPLRIDEILEIAPRLILESTNYTTDQKIDFVNCLLKHKHTNTDITLGLYRLHETFLRIEWLLSTAQANNFKEFTLYTPIKTNGFTPIHAAIQDTRYGLDFVTYLIKTFKIDWSIQDNNGNTPLHAALMRYYDRENMVQLVLDSIPQQDQKRIVNIENKDDLTPLFLVLRPKGPIEIKNDEALKLIKTLLSHQADPNAANKEGNTPLHITAQDKLSDISQLLIEYGANINARNNEGKTPVDLWPELTVILDRTNQVKNLKLMQDILDKKDINIDVLKNGANAVDIQGDSALRILCLKFDANYNEKQREQFYKTIEIFLQAGANINDPKQRILKIAVESDDRDFVRFLLDHGAKPNIKEQDLYAKTALETALSFRGNTFADQNILEEIIQMLEDAEEEQASKAKLE